MTRKDNNGDQPSGGETTWTNSGVTRSCTAQDRLTWIRHAEAFLRPTTGHYGCLMMMMKKMMRIVGKELFAECHAQSK